MELSWVQMEQANLLLVKLQILEFERRHGLFVRCGLFFVCAGHFRAIPMTLRNARFSALLEVGNLNFGLMCCVTGMDMGNKV